MSHKQRETNRQKTEIKKELIKEYGYRCFFCGEKTRQLDLVHLLRQGTELKQRINKRNCKLGCRACHVTFDDGTLDEVMLLPFIHKALKIMKELDYHYWYRYTHRK